MNEHRTNPQIEPNIHVKPDLLPTYDGGHLSVAKRALLYVQGRFSDMEDGQVAYRLMEHSVHESMPPEGLPTDLVDEDGTDH